MRVLLVRVGTDTTADGGGWNAPVDSRTRLFAYVPIPEKQRVRPGTERPYSRFEEAVSARGAVLPAGLLNRHAHLDPDFEHLTYGHPNKRARRILECGPGDVLVFYCALRDVGPERALLYAFIGVLVVEEIVDAGRVAVERYDENAHTRRDPLVPSDVVVRGRPEQSGRLERCLPFCDYRDGSYRVRSPLLEQWGGISSRNGFVVRAPWLISVGDAKRFLDWFYSHDLSLVNRNN
jgi:hypothetical protein